MEKSGQKTENARKWQKEKELLMGYAARQHIPFNVTFELTARCTLRCQMCYVHLEAEQADKKGTEKSAEEWIKMGRQAMEAGAVQLLLTGGEPLLHPEFEKIYTALCQMGFIILIYTNATLIDEKIQRLFQKYPPTVVAVTLYGASPETYEKVCGVKTGFERTIQGLERLKTVPTILKIRTTFIHQNMYEYKEIFQLAKKYTNYYQMTVDVFQSFEDVSTDATACRLSPEERRDFIKRYNKYVKEFQDPKMEQEMREEKGGQSTGAEIEPKILSCVAGKSSCCITWDGRMVACSIFSQPFTEPFTEGFQSAWDRLPGLHLAIKKPEKCLSCEMGKGGCPSCPPKLYLETGSFEKTSDYICECARIRKENHDRKVESV